ncbi:MAG: SDR family NAD(P)-dependent oxidoreductase [Anaerolinea sp.]|nr:SDR family NAD(P)-dependent oxidoreductase [Anaerolinea sp.]
MKRPCGDHKRVGTATVLVTGAAGFIGSHLVEALVRDGFRVRAFIRYTSGGEQGGNLADLPADVRAQIETYAGDLRDPDAVRSALRGVDTVYHLGAIISIPYSYRHPEETVSVNIGGTLNVLQAMRHWETRRGVIVSTSEVYGSALYTPIDEKHPLQPQSPYSASKIGAESISLSFQRSFDTPVVVVRPFNTFGERQSARAVIPTIISQALTRDTVTLGAVHTYRDYTHASDTARGLICAAAADAAVGQVVNLGTGQTITIGDLAALIIRLIGREVTVQANEVERLRPAASEVSKLQSDNRLAASLIGWTPQIGLDEGLRRTIRWIGDHLNQFDPHKYAV